MGAAALFIALAFLLPSSGSNDEKSKHLLQSSFDEENNPDVIERERSVFKKGLPKPDISEFTGQLVSVQEEVAVAMTENIVTEEIPWPSKDEGSFDNVVDTNKASPGRQEDLEDLIESNRERLDSEEPSEKDVETKVKTELETVDENKSNIPNLFV